MENNLNMEVNPGTVAPQKNKNKTNKFLVIGIIVLLIAVIVLGALLLLGKDKKEDKPKDEDTKEEVKSNENSDVESNNNDDDNDDDNDELDYVSGNPYGEDLSSQEQYKDKSVIVKGQLNLSKVKQLISQSYFETSKGEDIIDYGLNANTKLVLAINSLMENDKNVKSQKCKDAFDKDSNAKYSEGYYEITYAKGKTTSCEASSDVRYLSYEDVNAQYKALFNSTAPKATTTYGIGGTYYYSKVNNRFYEPEFAIGCTICDKHTYNIMFYAIAQDKLVIDINYTTFKMDYSKKEGYTKITLAGDKNAVYDINTDEDNWEEKFTAKVAKENPKLITVYRFTYELSQSSNERYYLKSIEKGEK